MSSGGTIIGYKVQARVTNSWGQKPPKINNTYLGKDWLTLECPTSPEGIVDDILPIAAYEGLMSFTTACAVIAVVSAQLKTSHFGVVFRLVKICLKYEHKQELKGYSKPFNLEEISYIMPFTPDPEDKSGG